MLKLLKSTPVQLLTCIIFAFILGNYLNFFYVSLFYTISSCIIELLMFVLPFMVFAFIFNAIDKVDKNSLSLILLIFLGITLSNFFSLSLAYLSSQSLLPLLNLSAASPITTQFKSTIIPLMHLPLPFLNTGIAMVLALTSGVTTNFFSEENSAKKFTQQIVSFLFRIVTLFLQKVFTPLLPLYVFGFCLKLSYDHALSALFQSYGKVFILSSLIIWLVIPIIYLIAATGNLHQALQNMKRMFPAGLTGFSTMSSAATMPVTLKCTQENLQNNNLTNLIIPTTVNTHLLGDNITIILSSMALLTFFGMPQPDLWTFIPFALAYCVAALSCVGVPGGTILIVLPILQNFLNFTPEMLSAITTIYVLQDPFGTTANVVGNGGFALLIQRFFQSEKNAEIRLTETI